MCSRPFRPLGFPIYVACRPAAPFARRYPRSFTFYVADPVSSIETRSLPTLARCYPRSFAFYVADPVSSIHPFSFFLLHLAASSSARIAETLTSDGMKPVSE